MKLWTRKKTAFELLKKWFFSSTELWDVAGETSKSRGLLVKNGIIVLFPAAFGWSVIWGLEAFYFDESPHFLCIRLHQCFRLRVAACRRSAVWICSWNWNWSWNWMWLVYNDTVVVFFYSSSLFFFSLHAHTIGWTGTRHGVSNLLQLIFSRMMWVLDKLLHDLVIMSQLTNLLLEKWSVSSG